MKNSLFFKNVITYTLFGGIEKLLPFLTLPFLTRIFSVQEIGYYVLCQTIAVIIYPLLTFEASSVISINYYHFKRDEFAKSHFTGLFVCILLTILCFLLCISFGGTLSNMIKFPLKELLLLVIATPFILLVDNHLIILRNENKAIRFGLVSSLRASFIYGIALYFIIYQNGSWSTFVYTTLGTNIVMAFFSYLIMIRKKWLKLEYTYAYIKDGLKVGVPISIHVIGAWLSGTANQFIVNIVLGVAATGRYGIGATFGTIMSFIQTCLNKAYIPLLFRNIKESQIAKNTQMKKCIFAIIMLSFILITSIGYFSIEYFFGNQYSSSKVFIFPLVMSATIQGLYKLYSSYFFYYKKTGVLMTITISMGILNIPIVLLLMQYFGVLGAAYSTTIISALTLVLTYHYYLKLA